MGVRSIDIHQDIGDVIEYTHQDNVPALSINNAFFQSKWDSMFDGYKGSLLFFWGTCHKNVGIRRMDTLGNSVDVKMGFLYIQDISAILGSGHWCLKIKTKKKVPSNEYQVMMSIGHAIVVYVLKLGTGVGMGSEKSAKKVGWKRISSNVFQGK